jgi:hypothetical protein
MGTPVGMVDRSMVSTKVPALVYRLIFPALCKIGAVAKVSLNCMSLLTFTALSAGTNVCALLVNVTQKRIPTRSIPLICAMLNWTRFIINLFCLLYFDLVKQVASSLIDRVLSLLQCFKQYTRQKSASNEARDFYNVFCRMAQIVGSFQSSVYSLQKPLVNRLPSILNLLPPVLNELLQG